MNYGHMMCSSSSRVAVAVVGRTAIACPFGYKACVACSRSAQAALLLLPFVDLLRASRMRELYSAHPFMDAMVAEKLATL